MTWTVYDISNSMLLDNMITSIAIDSIGNKWLGMYSGKVAKFDGLNWTIYDQSNSPLPYGLIFSLAVDQSNNVWIGVVYDAGYGPGKSSLLKFDGTNWTHYNTTNNGLPGGISTITVDSANNLWLGFRWCSLIKFDGTAFTFYNNHNSGCPGCEILCTIVDKNGNLWMGTNGGGLTVFHEGGIVDYVDKKESTELPGPFYLS